MPQSSIEKDTISTHFDINRDSIVLIALATICKIDILTLILLYEKYGKDIFYIFYMFQNAKFKFPNQKKLFKLFKIGEELKQLIKKKDLDSFSPKTKQEQEILNNLKSYYNPKFKEFSIKTRVPEDSEEIFKTLQSN